MRNFLLLFTCLLASSIIYGQNVGIGTAVPTERLEIATGNIKLTGSTKGIILGGLDPSVTTRGAGTPFITRGGNDTFTLGFYAGVGRWGMFKETNRIKIGLPDSAGNGLEVVTYNTNSTVSKVLMKVTQDGRVDVNGAVTRSAKTGAAHLLPIAYGSINDTGAIRTGSGNFTVVHHASGFYIINIAGETYSPDTHIALVSPYSNISRTFSIHSDPFYSITGFIVRLWTNTVNFSNTNFSFVVYKP